MTTAADLIEVKAIPNGDSYSVLLNGQILCSMSSGGCHRFQTQLQAEVAGNSYRLGNTAGSFLSADVENFVTTYVVKRSYGLSHDYLHGWCEQWGTSCMGSIMKAMTFTTMAEAEAAAEKAQRECKGSDGQQAQGFTFTAIQGL